MTPNKKWQKVTDKDELVVLVLRSEKEFNALRNHWQELQKRLAGFGSSFNQAYNQWKIIAKGADCKLLLITVWDGTLLIGVAPLYKEYFSSASHNLLNGFLVNSNQHSIKDFSSISVDRSYLELFSERLVDFLKPGFLGTDLLDLKKSTSYVETYLYPKLREIFPLAD